MSKSKRFKSISSTLVLSCGPIVFFAPLIADSKSGLQESHAVRRRKGRHVFRFVLSSTSKRKR